MLAGYAPLAFGLSWLAYRHRRWPAALAAGLLTGLAPLVFTLSRLVMAEVLATGLAVISVALAVAYRQRNHTGYLAASGLFFGLSLLTKTLNPFVIAPIMVLVLAGQPRRSLTLKRLAGLGLWWVAGALLPVVIILMFYDARALVDQTIAFRGDLRAAIPGNWADTWGHFRRFFEAHWGYWLLAAGGALAPFKHSNIQHLTPQSSNVPTCQRSTLIWLIWLLAGAAMLAWHTPLFYHHLVVLLPPLILLGAGFIAETVQRVNVQSSTFNPPSSNLQPFFILVIAIAAFNLPAIIAANQAEAAIVTGGRETAAISLLQAVSAPADFVMGDSQLLIFMANRRTPPPLGDVALVAIKAGRQTSAKMAALTQQYQSPAVVQWSLRLPWLPDYLAWVEQNYLARRVWDNDHLIYFAPRRPAGAPLPHAQNTPLGPGLALRGFTVDTTAAKPGSGLNVRLYWQTAAPLAQDYTVFTQLLTPAGAWAAGWDSQPLGGYFPTGQWPAGEIIPDIVQFPLPADLPAGDYTLITGMYRLDTLERLTTPAGADFIPLGDISVGPGRE
jgi:4-amino-4-deoxy-L-arabinose transferase-like glycosyltransferase